MKKFIFLIVFLLLSSPVALAQKKVSSAPPCPLKPCPCTKTFEGFFVGGNAGFGVGVVKVQDNLSSIGLYNEPRIGIQGFDGGVNAGYLKRWGDVSLGLEGVFSWSNVRGTNYVRNPSGINSDKIQLTNSLQVRIPVAYVISQMAAPKILVGWNNSEIKKDTFNLPSSSGRFNGVLWGAGIDLLLVKNLIGGVEYTGVAFAGRKFDLQGGDTGAISPLYNKFAFTLKYIFPHPF